MERRRDFSSFFSRFPPLSSSYLLPEGVLLQLAEGDQRFVAAEVVLVRPGGRVVQTHDLGAGEVSPIQILNDYLVPVPDKERTSLAS